MTHLVALGASWSLWRWACLRAAGFPASAVLELADAELAAVADHWLDLETAAARARETLITDCKSALERMSGGAQRSVRRALKQLWRHRVPEPITDEATERTRARFAEAAARLQTQSDELAASYLRARRAVSETLRRTASDERFRQAVLWQNRNAVATGIDWLLRQPITATDNQTRKNERLVASYLQRYCVKNDTIGFFGPVGWARFVDGDLAIAQRPGASLLAERTVYYEYWAVDALARRFSDDPELRPHMAPRRLPQFRLDGTTLHYPIGRTAELSPALAAVFARCDGMRTARAIARELVAAPGLVAGEPDVLTALDELAGAGAILWAFEVPTAATHPERDLAAQLTRIDDGETRRRHLQVLDTLDRHRTAVAASASAAQLDEALRAFEAAFTAAAGVDSHRAHGRTYAGRTPLYEDCRRDHELEIGRPFVERLAPALALVLASARWFTHEIATRYRQALGAIHRRLRPADGSPVDFAVFWREVPALFPGAGSPGGSIVVGVREELHRRWAAILAVAPGEPAVQRRASALAAEVQRRFAATCPGWPSARHCSPDILIAAGPGALARGDYAVILGELHTGFNTVYEPMFVKQHPHPGELIAARDLDLDRVCIAPVWSKAITRGDYYSMSPRDLDLESGDTRSARPREQVLPTGELVVDERDRNLEVRTRDGARRFDIIAFLEHHLIAESFAAFSLTAPAPRTPRVTIDGVVVARAAWRIAPATVAWPALDEPAARFVAARRWARSLGLPRWVFARTPEEVKPVYVDFDSAIYVEMLAKQLRGASLLALSEMLPTAEDTWLVDAGGARYTAELRLAAVDPEPWRAPGGEPSAAFSASR